MLATRRAEQHSEWRGQQQQPPSCVVRASVCRVLLLLCSLFASLSPVVVPACPAPLSAQRTRRLQQWQSRADSSSSSSTHATTHDSTTHHR